MILCNPWCQAKASFLAPLYNVSLCLYQFDNLGLKCPTPVVIKGLLLAILSRVSSKLLETFQRYQQID